MKSLSLTSHRNHSRGFTLLEIMLVVMIIGLLAGLAINMIRGNLDISREVRARSDIKSISVQLVLYESQNGNFPTMAQGIRALVEKPSDDPKPRRWTQLLGEMPIDGWNHEYHYEYPARRSTAKFDVYSDGKDGVANTDDDIGNWNEQ